MLFSELLEQLKLENYELLSDGSFEIWDYCTAETQKQFLSFIEKEKFVNRISPFASCLFCTAELAEKVMAVGKGICVVDEPKAAFHLVHNYFALADQKRERAALKTGTNCKISENAYVDSYDVVIGDNVTIEDNVVIKAGTIIGNNVVIRSGAVIGGQSFSHVRQANGETLGLVDMGKVIIEDNSDIYPMVHIARGILPDDITWIKKNVVIDALTYIGHGVHVGESTLIAARSAIGGNTHIGKRVWIGIGATVTNRIKIADDARVSLGAVVTKNVDAGVTVSGNFAIEHHLFLKKLKEKIANGSMQ